MTNFAEPYDSLGLSRSSRAGARPSGIFQRDPRQSGAKKVFLLILNTDDKTLSALPFQSTEEARASEKYFETEIATQRAPVEVVLVSVQSVRALRKAFPNYFADTTAFIHAVKLAIAPQVSLASLRQSPRKAARGPER